MNKRIIPLLVILIFTISCIAIVSATNNTTDNLTAGDIEEDSNNYIIPVRITDNGIEFSDGFTGFCLDSSKDTITANDKFTSGPTNNDELQNHVKIAIIECYKAGKEDDIQNVVLQVLNGNRTYDVVESVFSSTETISDTAVVNINNTTEATFTFELLKSTDDSKSDCLAYTVSFRTISNEGLLGASNDDANQSASNETSNQSNSEDATTANNNTESNSEANGKGSTDGQTVINETNNTIINKTNTVIVNETNTTVINKNNTKIINKTNETPQNATLQNTIMRVVGNPIFLLVIVIVIIAIAAFAVRRKN